MIDLSTVNECARIARDGILIRKWLCKFKVGNVRNACDRLIMLSLFYFVRREFSGCGGC
jgi:hypothetical protein